MKTITNYFNIIEIVLKNKENEISLSDIIKESGLTRLTATRLVASLKKDGFLSQSKKKGKYSIGVRLIYLTGLVNQKSNIGEIAHPLLIKLNQSINELVIYVSWDGHRVFPIEEFNAKHSLAIIPNKSLTAAPMYSTAAGKLFLSQMSGQELDTYLENTELRPLTPNTITDKAVLKDQLGTIAKDGIAFDNEESSLGVNGIAAIVKQAFTRVHFCVCVIGPSARLTGERIAEIIPEIRQCASEISEGIEKRNNIS